MLTSGHAEMISIYSPKFCHVVKAVYFNGSYGVFRVFFNMAADQITAGLKERNLRPGVQ